MVPLATGFDPVHSIESARRALTARLRSAGIEEPALDARLLVGAALQLDLTGLVTQAARRLTSEETLRLEQYALRRLAHEPVARIVGTREFWGMPFRLSEATLVPRPDTETVVELALEIFRELTVSGRPPRIADIGTGSGAILLALLHEIPDALGIGTDISLTALSTARDNAVALGLGGRAAFVACSYAAALRGPFDLIVSNPPYIPSAEIPTLSVEVREHDPHLALDGGNDGYDAYRALIPQASERLAPGGVLIVEAGRGQAGNIETLMAAAGLTMDRSPKADLAGIPRAVSARKMPP
ncbi:MULTISPECIES: peptide chain release factor N(5)-glutamine methyltransferase [unclassified Bradyrhizobium]|uniref:peptide chain release factor N(5)-glutamine methyltransferase n=1 Tax=unclassified Bradyrhizobium TaxID=2631580 RepID=UPI00211DFE98|nr:MULTISPECIES: peptide chain release factor N(5)-glutamine methyltransferase [unclassified Bradyrhizobium]MDD1536394.1 peptide chain release factor N(5)-glutamine methyltransferase [Bradyrhizobium sp. WBOS8]MDD1586199.1 peptide chain release factor N(5)-glutamine methyltransferase [Bradyrhizobium sp. WBOS4]UUO45900.1 peptide chain release factor N(5)-glutamine methyltransferase [Bradyrhizobium sp. WBOS04]UUO59604.1 peptide chain release factor N(5)-glutamine methyltransferase [Bradyrhizobium 